MAFDGEHDEFNYTNHAGARALQDKLQAFWAKPENGGHPIRVELHEMGFDPAIRAGRFDLRSDMINGLPRVEFVRRTTGMQTVARFSP